MKVIRRSSMRAFLIAILISTIGFSCSPASAITATPKPNTDLPAPREDEKTRTAIFGMGCFWCAEAVFEQLTGVNEVVAGYAGGDQATATYEKYHDSNHAEAIKITYDPRKITY